MRLDHLCDADWTYDLIHSVEPSEQGDGALYGQGTGSLTGRLAGQAQWSNAPRLRGDHAHPDARGVIVVPSGRSVLFRLTGLSSLTDGRGVHVLMFQTDDPEHEWLNTVIAVGEGSIDPGRGLLAMRYYECVVDHLPDLPS
ncbi:hypothetical protein ACPPVT_01220 [Angustibacter sp. McL0619]|uniref:hypothetical protein n=1 Tax=Angustibacter sp. McL0619 TaxID=3415676 RepID=UPI003CFB9469